MYVCTLTDPMVILLPIHSNIYRKYLFIYTYNIINVNSEIMDKYIPVDINITIDMSNKLMIIQMLYI